ncbi:MAG: hypothetical protein IPG74_15540 [Flavobacteriales bacterium]|nr:hypothetical protein [Flavobacteriales bacterium]
MEERPGPDGAPVERVLQQGGAWTIGAGKLGALLAHKFMHGWFGIASFAFVLWSFLGGVRILLGTWLLPKGKTMRWTLMALL